MFLLRGQGDALSVRFKLYFFDCVRAREFEILIQDFFVTEIVIDIPMWIIKIGTFIGQFNRSPLGGFLLLDLPRLRSRQTMLQTQIPSTAV